MWQYENELKAQGFSTIAGVDEAGRGPLVGPVVAAAVILPDNFQLDGLNDSKQLSEKKRDSYFAYISEHALAIGVGIVSAKEIDKINIYQATKLSMIKAVAMLQIKPDYIIIDGNMKFTEFINYQSIIKGDGKSYSIAAASIIAKVTRDNLLKELHVKYPNYGFDKHKGYPTKKHIDAIWKYGIIDEYRKTYKPVSNYIKENQ